MTRALKHPGDITTRIRGIERDVAGRHKPNVAWIPLTLTQGWTPLASTLPGYCMDTAGWVHFRGAIVPGTVGAVIDSLPDNWGPEYITRLFAACTGAYGATIRVDPNGDFQVERVNAAPTWVSLDGLNYRSFGG